MCYLPSPNAAILALCHCRADSDNRRAFDEPSQAVRHVKKIAGHPAVLINERAEIAKQRGSIEYRSLPPPRGHAWRTLAQEGLPGGLEAVRHVIAAKRRHASDSGDNGFSRPGRIQLPQDSNHGCFMCLQLTKQVRIALG